jgi:hypothetical protein
VAKSDDEIERLLAEVDGTLGRGGRTTSGSGQAEPAKPPGKLEMSARVGAVSGALAAAGVFALFAVLPFFGAFSGAAGAFVATFCIIFAQRLTGKRGKK